MYRTYVDELTISFVDQTIKDHSHTLVAPDAQKLTDAIEAIGR